MIRKPCPECGQPWPNIAQRGYDKPLDCQALVDTYKPRRIGNGRTVGYVFPDGSILTLWVQAPWMQYRHCRNGPGGIRTITGEKTI